tara:strand:- start:624 stop:956 length:333 start_codon:yes stop_codon:yes gene_type:complete
MLLTFADKYIIMAFMIKRQENKRVKNTLEKSQNYSRMPLTNDDNYIIMANMTNNNNTQEDTKIMFQVVQTIVRGGEWQQDIVATFATESEAVAFAKRCHNGNPTTRVIKK